jgi:EAL domain-containing protein (putative c-di-GMP-specific phosphodiesterase class I)
VADSVGLMLEIDRLVLRQVALQARQWALDSQADFFLSFNLSPGHFARPEVATEVRQLLEECRVPAGRLRIEITESAIIGNIEAASRTAAQLRESGVKLCLDDFGTGYSSLNYLRVLPLDGLKVDRSFVERMVSDTRDFGVVKTIVDLAHYLQLYCVVEGVETSEQHELLQVLGADFLQGYLFSPAVPAEQAEQMLRAPTAVRRIA